MEAHELTQWPTARITATRLRWADHALLKDAEDKSATQAVSQAEDRALFERKCSHCHTPEPRPDRLQGQDCALERSVFPLIGTSKNLVSIPAFGRVQL